MPYYGGDPMRADPKALMARLMRNGMSRMQAAAMVGNLQRESSLISNNMNRGEGAYGLMQWRGPRFQQLQDFAKAQGLPWTDANAQIDFISHELGGTEKRNALAFQNARSIDEASAALQPYIRYSMNPRTAGTTERMMFARNHYGAPIDPAPQAPAASPPAPQPVGARPDVFSRENRVPPRGRGLRYGIESLGDLGEAAVRAYRTPYEQRTPAARAISDWFGGGQASSGDNPRQVASNLPFDYTEPATGNRMASGYPGRYEQGDILNLGPQPSASAPAAAASAPTLPPGQDPPRFPGGIVPLPREAPRARPVLSDWRDPASTVAELGSLVDPMRFDYG